MTEQLGSLLAAARTEARGRAEAELERLGYTRTDAGWLGVLTKGGHSAPVTIRLPPAFPDVLPEIRVQDPERYPAYAHIERSGKLCLAPATGTLIDARRPERVLADALQRAAVVLFPPAAAHEADLFNEFSSYWPSAGAEQVRSICPTPLPTGPIAMAQISGNADLIAAPDLPAAEQWASRTGNRLGQSKSAFAIPLKQLFRPPRFTEKTTLGELFGAIDSNGEPGAGERLRRWLNDIGLPAYVLASAPVPAADGYVEFGALIRGGSGVEASRWKNGFRPGHAPRSRQIAFAATQPIMRVDVQRNDAAFLVERGGGVRALLDKNVVVVGCGAVGSFVSVLLAATGIGNLRLIDPECLGPENIHRHVLGADKVGQHKVTGLRDLIQRRYPHINVASKSDDVLAVLEKEPAFVVEGTDAVVIAVGDETIERRLNRVLPANLLRVHVWLEPLGLGGHTLITGTSRSGCYECLYRLDDVHGLVNMAGLSAPGQHFQRTVAGCGGTYTPFGAIDAQGAATEAVRMITESILSRAAAPMLKSWVTSVSAFTDAGHHLSPRGAAIQEGCSRIDAHFAQPECRVCTGW